MTPRLPLPVKLLKESFDIDETSHTGLRRKWRPRHHFKSDATWKYYNRMYACKPAGGLKGQNKSFQRYLVRFEGKDWQVARIVWAIHHGEDPKEGHVDHIDGNPMNNSVSNLRIADPSQSIFNQRARDSSLSGYRGVQIHRNGKWFARIMSRGIEVNLGIYDKLEDAIKARIEAELIYHGEFAYSASRIKINDKRLALFS